MLVPEAARATAVSVGVEPNGVPAGRASRRRRARRASSRCWRTSSRRRRRDVPERRTRPGAGRSRRRRRPGARARARGAAHARRRPIGTRGAPLARPSGARPEVFSSRACTTATEPRRQLARGPAGRGSGALRSSARRAAAARPPHRACSRGGRSTSTSIRLLLARRPGTGASCARHARRRGRLRRGGGADASGGRSRARRCATARSTGTPRAPRRLRRAIARASRSARRSPMRPQAPASSGCFASTARRGPAVGGGRRRDRRRRRAPARRALRALPPDGVGGRRGEAAVGARGLTGAGVPRARVLGHRRLRAAVPGRDASRPRPGDARVPRPPARPPRARRARHRSRRRALPVGVGGRRRRRDARPRAARHRRGRPHPHRRARGAHRRRRRLGGRAATSTGPATRPSRPGPGASCSSRRRATGRRASASTRDGRAHIYGVIGPDEYHEPVDDNAFTNVMARWNLRPRRARSTVSTRRSARSWLALADALVDGYDRATGVYEQFAGFFELEPLVIADVAPRRPIAADLLLGRERTRRRAGREAGRRADAPPPPPRRGRARLARAEPRLLRAAHRARQLALAGDPRVALRPRRPLRPALEALRIAARIDLDDLTGTTAGGLHLATMGGVWQALVFGFAGRAPAATASSSTRGSRREWNALELACASAASRSGCPDRPSRRRDRVRAARASTRKWDLEVARNEDRPRSTRRDFACDARCSTDGPSAGQRARRRGRGDPRHG